MSSVAIPLAAAGIVLGLVAPAASESRTVASADDFWTLWGDGQAEVASYDLVFPRYGERREGTAVTIFVTETFSDEARVKADPGVHPDTDEYPVMKLNLVRDFPTGIYDYNLMTSAFYSLVPFRGRPAGSPMKVSFSSQEWCGQVYHQILPDETSIRSISHSYFDGEADLEKRLDYPVDAILEDGLFHWARELATPLLEPGERRTIRILRSLDHVRLAHVPLDWAEVELARGPDTQTVEVPAGRFVVEERTAGIEGGRAWTFLVEAEVPHRIVRWETSDGQRADLVASERVAYWERNQGRFLDDLGRLGLSPRPPRTP